MKEVRQGKMYKLFKRIFFITINFILKTIDLKNWEYYYSKWVADDGDNTLLTKYPLNPDSLVIDVGGYTGYFSDKINSLYNPHLIIFEPVKKYYKVLKSKYRNKRNVEIYNYGLANKNSLRKIYLSNDGTSLIKKSDKSEKIKLVDVASFLNKFKLVNLISINIEGAEYDVLDRIIETKLIKKIKFLQVQFHNFIPDSQENRKRIVNKILKTHKIRYSYPFVWESFEMKNIKNSRQRK